MARAADFSARSEIAVQRYDPLTELSQLDELTSILGEQGLLGKDSERRPVAGPFSRRPLRTRQKR